MKIGQAINGLDQRSTTPIIGTAPTRTESSELLDDAEWLRREYVDNERTYRDIAAEAQCGWSTVRRAIDRHGITARPAGPKARQIDRALLAVADDFAGIIDEMTARLQQDKANHPPSWSFIGTRFKRVTEAAKATEETWAQRMALIELASAALLVAEAKTPSKR
jgi:hypothetical protein